MDVVKNPNQFISSSSSHHKIVVDENNSMPFNFDDFKFVKPLTPKPKVGGGNVSGGGVQQKRAKIVNE
jgi:hypothetical protein